MLRRFHQAAPRLGASLLAAAAVCCALTFPAFAEETTEENTLTIQVTDCSGENAAGVSVIVRGTTTGDEKEEDYVAYAVTDKNGIAEVSFTGKLEATVHAGGLEKKFSGSKAENKTAVAGVHDEKDATEKVITPATCTEEGKSEISGKCPLCDKAVDRKVQVAPLGHKWDKGTVTREPTCTKAGIRTLKCTREGCTETTTEKIKKLPHEEASPVSEHVVKSTCTKKGSHEAVIYCETCDFEFSRNTVSDPVSAHTPGEPVRTTIKEATCEEAGSYQEVITCTDCGETLSSETKTQEALGHSAAEAVRENEKAATCTQAGSYESVVYCSRCHAEQSRETVTTEKTDHTPAKAVKENVKAATCTQAGSYESVVYCEDCKAEISRETKTIKAKGHTKGDMEVDNETLPTCTEGGSYDQVVSCEVCGAEISRTKKYQSATGHTEDTPIRSNVVAATCSKTGSYDEVVKCKTCKEVIRKGTVTVPTTGHTSVKDAAVDATCTTAGLTVGYHCSNCRSVLVAQNSIPALGHSWDSGKVTKAAEVGKEGTMTYTCLRNPSHTRTDIIPALKAGETTSISGGNSNVGHKEEADEKPNSGYVGNGNGPLLLNPDGGDPAAAPDAPLKGETAETVPAVDAAPEKAPAARKGSVGILNILLLLATIGIAVATFLLKSDNRMRLAAPAPAVMAMILFFVSQRFGGRLVFADLWTIPLLILAATAGVLFFAVSGFGEEEDDAEEEENDLSDFEEI